VAKPSKERVAEYRLRQKTGESIPECRCGRPLKGSLSKKRQLCKVCYDSSPVRRHLRWVNISVKRGRELYSENVQEYKGYKVGGQAIAPNGSRGIIQSITCWGNGDVAAAVEFDDGDKDTFLLYGFSKKTLAMC
jgi:hypothetical protein